MTSETMTPQEKFIRFLEVCEQGKVDKEVAFMFNVPIGYVTASRRLFGIIAGKYSANHQSKRADRNAAIVAALKADHSMQHKVIAEKIGVTVCVVNYIAKQNNIRRLSKYDVGMPFQ